MSFFYETAGQIALFFIPKDGLITKRVQYACLINGIFLPMLISGFKKMIFSFI